MRKTFGLKIVNHYKISSGGSSKQTCRWWWSRGQHHYSETTEIQRCNILGSVSQFEATAVQNKWMLNEKAAHLLSVLQSKAADILHPVPIEAM
jgi:hypothetical protein